jgi:pre-rRNA-processing protein TSR1
MLLLRCCSQARSTDGSDPCSVLPGSWVTVVLADVPAAAAASILERTAAAAAAACSAAAAGVNGMSLDATSVTSSAASAVPLTVYGLLQHEAKLSVVNFSIKKAASYAETIRSKEELLLVCGLRSFMGQPVLSDDAQGADKNKMERFLHPGKTAVGSVYAPISFPPLPLLAFKVRYCGDICLGVGGVGWGGIHAAGHALCIVLAAVCMRSSRSHGLLPASL